MRAGALLTVRDMAYISISIATISVGACISVPAAVPFTMQTFAIFLCSSVLGSKRGLIAVACYALLGALGLPVFAGMNAGFGVLVGPTGGYITGFLPAAAIAGWRSDQPHKILVDITQMIIALTVCYVFGTVWYTVGYLGDLSGVGTALMACVVPYIIPDLLKILLAATIAPRLRRALNR